MSMTEVVEVVDVEVDGVGVVGEVEDGVMEGVVDGVVFEVSCMDELASFEEEAFVLFFSFA